MKILSAILFSVFAAVLFLLPNESEAAAVQHCPDGLCKPALLCPPWTKWDEKTQRCHQVAFCPGQSQVQIPGGPCILHCRAGSEPDPFKPNYCRPAFKCPAGRVEIEPNVCEIPCPAGERQNPWRQGVCRSAFECPAGKTEMAEGVCCGAGEEINPFAARTCLPAFSCLGDLVEVADGVCQCPSATQFNRDGVCEPLVACGGGTITGENTCECPAEAPHYVNGKCLDKPYCPKNTSFWTDPATAGGFDVIECSECPPGFRRFMSHDYLLICQIPKECQAPEYALNGSNDCVPTNVCPGPEAGEPRYSQCRTRLAIRTLDDSKCPGVENEACRAAVAEARVAEALRTYDDSECPDGAKNEACRAAVSEARLTREFAVSPASQIKGMERAISLGLSGAGVTIGVGEQAGPYWEDDCKTNPDLSTLIPYIIYTQNPADSPLARPNEEVPARFANYEGGECDRGLVRTHSDFPSIRVEGNSRPPVSSRMADYNGGHVIAVIGVMAARKNGYGVAGVAPDADYAYAHSSYDWDASPVGVEIVNYSVGPSGGYILITSYAALDENGATLTTATRENMLRNERWPLSLTLRLEHVNTHAPADRRINVMASGNDSRGELGGFGGAPLYFPELRGNNLAVVAIGKKGSGIASYSNRCGLAGASFCLAAPVWGFAVGPDFYGDRFRYANGTSFAAPLVAGSLALMKEYFNRMGGIGNDELVRRLLATADKSGIYADESIYGAGVLDLGNALTPQGELQLLSGRSVSDSESHSLSASGLRTGAAFGDSIGKSLEGVQIAAFDNLNAPFPVDAAGLIQSEWESDSLRTALLAFQSEKSSSPKTQWDFANGFGWWSLRGGNRAGQPETESIFGADDAYANPYAALARDGMSGGLEWDAFRMEMFGESPGQGSRPRGAVGSFSFAPFSETTESGGWILHFGGVDEPNGFLSSSGSGAFGDLRSRTAFVGADYVGEKMNGWRIRLGGFAGDTSADNGEWFAGTESLRSDSFHLGVERENIFYSGDGLGFRLHQPLRASGSLKIRIPTGRTRYGDLTWREVSGKTSGRELALEGLYRRSFDGGSWRVSAGAVSEPGHRADAKTIGRMLFAFEREF